MTVRVNEEFTACRVSKGRDLIVEIPGDSRSDTCGFVPGRTRDQVCARVTRGVPSCILNIDRTDSNMEGTWTFTIDRDVRSRNISRSVNVDLVMVELPDAVYLQYDNQQFRDGDRDRSVTAELGRMTVQCLVDGGRPDPVLNLFIGGQNVTSDGRFCRSSGRNSQCVQFEVDITAENSGDTLR